MRDSFLTSNGSSAMRATLGTDSLCFSMLPPFLRVLLVTDGTVTKSLAAYFGEPIRIGVLSHSELASERAYPVLDLLRGDLIILRRVTLNGKRSKTIYALAESVVASARISERLRRELSSERKGIGELIRDSRLETYRDILSIKQSTADELATDLGVKYSARVAIRRYVVCIAGQAAIEIEEVFPESHYQRP